MRKITFYSCISCGKNIPPRWFKKAKKTGKVCKKCGSNRFRPSDASPIREMIYILWHPSIITKTLLWPGNWERWKDFLVPEIKDIEEEIKELKTKLAEAGKEIDRLEELAVIGEETFSISEEQVTVEGLR